MAQVDDCGPYDAMMLVCTEVWLEQIVDLHNESIIQLTKHATLKEPACNITVSIMAYGSHNVYVRTSALFTTCRSVDMLLSAPHTVLASHLLLSFTSATWMGGNFMHHVYG